MNTEVAQSIYVRSGGTPDAVLTDFVPKTVIGKGSFGIVYKGTNKKDSKSVVAIKAIDKSKLSKQEIDEIHDEVKLI